MNSSRKQFLQAMFNVLNDEPSIPEALNLGLQETTYMLEDTKSITQVTPRSDPQETHDHATFDQNIKNRLWNSQQERRENLSILPRNVQLSRTKNSRHQEHKHLSRHNLSHGHENQHPETTYTYISHPYNEYQDSHYHTDIQEEYKPRITKVELASSPRCRSVVTKECHTVPTVVPKKVSFDYCQDVPAVDCFFVLKNVPDIECSPKPYQDCTDVVKDVPYIGHEEQCEEVIYEECVEVKQLFKNQIFFTFCLRSKSKFLFKFALR